MTMREYDWDAMAARIESGNAPRSLAGMLRACYELGHAHGSGQSDAIDELGPKLRELMRPPSGGEGA